LQTRYIRGDRVLELLARVSSGGTVAWLLTDRNGSIRSVSDNTGVVIGTLVYDGYGNITSESSPTNSGEYKFVGYRFDKETGLYRPDPTVARYYIQMIGQWLSPDPYRFYVGESNLYLYALNNPVNRLDPTGLKCQKPDPCEEFKKEPKCKGLKKQPKPDPTKNPKLYGLAYCSKGEVKIDFYDPREGHLLRGDKCFKKCVLEHEEWHKKQFAAWCPWLCKCYPKDEFDVGYDNLSPKIEKTWECPAHVVFLLCLLKVIDEIMNKEKNPDHCNLAGLVDQRKVQIELLGMKCDMKIPPIPEAPKDPPVYPGP